MQLDDLLQDDDDVAAELLAGVELADAARRQAGAALVEDLLQTIPVEEYTLAVARAHARLLAQVRRIGKPRGAHDLIIAATAAATARVVVSSDATGFGRLPDVAVLHPPH